MKYTEILENYRSQKRAYRQSVDQLKRKNKSDLDSAFQTEHEKAFQKIDCLECANCCKTISPIFKDKDIERIAKSMKMKPGLFIERYLHLDSDNDYVLNETPCPFLGVDNYCSIYDVRPKACAEYPHTNHKSMHKHMKLVEKNLEVCPAVVEIVKRLDQVAG
ncbi:MAG: YkgJ family cysteine cluster protein [Cyclobacteriaceae bacterium]